MTLSSQRFREGRDTDPRGILGSILAVYLRADRVTPNASATLDNMLDGMSSATMAQATAGKKPIGVVSNGRPAVRFDGSDDALEMTLSPTLSGRSWMFMVAKLNTVRASFDYAGMSWTTNFGTGHLAICRTDPTNDRFTGFCGSTDGTDIVYGPPRDTSVHLFEIGFETSDLGRYVVDGIKYSGDLSGGPINGASNRLSLAIFQSPESAWGPFDIYEVGLCSSLPSDNQRQAIRDYVRRRYALRFPEQGGPLLLDTLTTQPLYACDIYRKLRRGYDGGMVRISRDSDGKVADIPASGDYLNTSMVASWCSGTVGRLVRVYDQSSNGRIYSQANSAKRPVIYSGGALQRISGTSAVAGLWSSASDSFLSRADLGGHATGNPAMTVGIAFQRNSGEARLFSIGNSSVAGAGFVWDAEVTRNCFLGIFGGGRGNRQLAYTTTAGTRHSWILKKPASAISGWEVEESGSNLSQTAVTNGTDTPSLATAAFNSIVIGNITGSAGDAFDGLISCWIGFDSVLAGADLAALRTELALHA